MSSGSDDEISDIDLELSCGEAAGCKADPKSCPNYEYVRLLFDVAAARGFPDLERVQRNDTEILLDGKRCSAGMYYARFLFSLMKTPAVTADGATFFVDVESFTIVLKTANGEFINFCKSYRCIRKAIVVSRNTAYCRLDCLPRILDAPRMYGAFLILDELFERDLEHTEENWKLVMSELAKDETNRNGVSKTFGDTTVRITFLPPKLDISDGALFVTIVGIKHKSGYFCQSPYCGVVSLYRKLKYCKYCDEVSFNKDTD